MDLSNVSSHMHGYLLVTAFRLTEFQSAGSFLHHVQIEILIRRAAEPSRQVRVHRNITSSVNHRLCEASCTDMNIHHTATQASTLLMYILSTTGSISISTCSLSSVFARRQFISGHRTKSLRRYTDGIRATRSHGVDGKNKGEIRAKDEVVAGMCGWTGLCL